MTTTIKVTELKVGMQIVERDGYLLKVVSISPAGHSLKIICEGANGQTENLVGKKWLAKVMA